MRNQDRWIRMLPWWMKWTGKPHTRRAVPSSTSCRMHSELEQCRKPEVKWFQIGGAALMSRMICTQTISRWQPGWWHYARTIWSTSKRAGLLIRKPIRLIWITLLKARSLQKSKMANPGKFNIRRCIPKYSVEEDDWYCIICDSLAKDDTEQPWLLVIAN